MQIQAYLAPDPKPSQVRHGTCTAKAAQRCVRFLKQHGCTPPDLNGHGFCFAKPLCTWLWYLCRLTLNSDKLHPKMKKWVREEAPMSEPPPRASRPHELGCWEGTGPPTALC